MAKAILIKDMGLTRIYKSSKNQLVRLEMKEDWTEIKFIDIISKKQFGEFEFKELEDGSYKLMRMYTEPNQNGGIGRAALEMFKDNTLGIDIVASPNNGQVLDDGSHPTGDAIFFVNKMIKEGIISGYENNNNNEGGFF